MVNGIHATIYSKDADAVRTFFRDVLEFPSVDAGHGWLIFALPPAELGVHPASANSHELYLICDDLPATIQHLKAKGVSFKGEVVEAGFGSMTRIALPGGGELGLYQPKHPSPLALAT